MNLTEQQLIAIGAMLVMLLMAWVIGTLRVELKQLEAIEEEAKQNGLTESGQTLVDFVTAKLRSR